MSVCNIPEELYALSLGRNILNYIKKSDSTQLYQQINAEALLLLQEILTTLDDDALDDPDCFYRVDYLVRAFQRRGLLTTRHSEVD